ncbi:MAG: hypothetical protein JO296_03815, partial [Pseudonocardiales bacterium]|nr:hypothetical protein [Pseudonocardiales bacterium]
MLLVTQIAALHAATGTAAVHPALPVTLQIRPRVDLMLWRSRVADLIDVANPAVVLVRVPIGVLHVAVLPVVLAIAVLSAHVTVTPVIRVTVAEGAVIPTIPILITDTTVVPVVPVVIVPPAVVPV